tara:strand:- start:195 stop:2354 length:2160 start_codon:yes stop_codon:yes gene_type:complete
MPLGSPLQFVSEASTGFDIQADPHNSNRWICSWWDDVGTAKALLKVFTLSGTTWTQSSEIDMGLAGTTARQSAVAWDLGTANKILVTYTDSSSQGAAEVGTISGSAGSESISWGTKLVWESTTSPRGGYRSEIPLLCLDTSGNYCIVFNPAGGTILNARILQVSGTDVTAGGSNTQITAAYYEIFQAGVDPADSTKVIAGYRAANGGARNLAVKELSISGTTITAGSETQGDTIGSNGLEVLPIDGTKTVILGTDNSTDYPFSQIYTEGGTWGTQEIAVSTAVYGLAADNNLSGSISTFVLAYALNSTPRNGYALTGTINAGVTSISYTAATQMDTSNNSNYFLRASQQSDAEGHFAMVYETSAYDNGWLNLGKTGGIGSNLTATNFVGIADAGISTSATGTIVVQGGTVTGMSSLTTGAKYYVQNDGTITSPDGPIAYTIAGATYDSVSLDVSSQAGDATGMCFNNDGTKMYVIGEISDAIYQYSLSSAYDLSTASYDSVSLSVSSQQTNPRSVVFNNDGSALYICGTSSADAHQYTLTTPYDLSTGSYASKTFSLSSQELYPCGLIFNNDGASMYVVGSQNKTVYQYTLSTPFDVSTASYASKSMSVTSEQSSPTGLAFNSDGTKIFVIGETTPKINQYSLSSAYDASTGSYDSVSYTYTQGSIPRDIVFNSTGLKFYIPDSGTDDVFQYTVGGGATSSVNAGLAISTTSLLLNGDS